MLHNLLFVLDIFGVVVFAASACLLAANRKVDMVGFILLAVVTGIGGGTMRDVLLGRLPVFWVTQPVYLWACIGTACAMFFLAHKVHENRKLILWADALGLSVFSVIGCSIALHTGAPVIVALFMGAMTACFGGIIRDLLAGEPTLVFRREIYVTAASLGAMLYAVCVHVNWNENFALLIGALGCFGLRAAAICLRLNLPGYSKEAVLLDSGERRN